ncbi:MAG TPA: hypothetical protein VI197_29610 [Polyangiaceae bacterium]
MTSRPSLHPVLMVVPVVGVLLAYRMGFARDQIITGAALAVPLALAGWAFVRANELGDRARRWALLSLFAVALASEISTWRAVLPPTPIHAAALSTTRPDAELTLPSGATNFFVELASPSAGDDAEGKVSVVLERDHAKRTLAAEFHNHVVTTGRGSNQSVHDSERYHLSLPGAGPIRAHLDSASGSMGRQIQLALFDDPLWARALVGVMLAGLGVSLWLAGSRLVSFAGFAPVLGVVAAYGWYLPLHLGKSDRTSSLFGVIIVAIALGGLGTLLAQGLLRKLWPAPRRATAAGT